MDASEPCRLKALEDENTRLKRLLADAMLDNAAFRASARCFTRPAGQDHRRKRTRNWIKLGATSTLILRLFHSVYGLDFIA